MSIQFERAEFTEAAPSAAVCSACDQSVVQSYYEIGGKIVCSACREKRDRALDGSGFIRFLRATAAGLVVGIAGAIVWWAIRRFANMELGIVSIFIGVGVGKAVRWGAHEKGGWFYQSLAILLTYSAIVLNYVPDVAEGMLKGAPELPGIILYPLAYVVAYALPVLGGFENIIGMIIIAVGLYEAWKFNKRVDLTVTGPYTVTPAATPLPANV